MSLKKIIAKDYRDVEDRANALFRMSTIDIGKMIEHAYQDSISIIASLLVHHGDEIDYLQIQRQRTLDRIQTTLYQRFENLSIEVEDYWTTRRKDYDLLSRLSASFIARKASPPWIIPKLNLKDPISKDGKYDPRMGHLRFYFRNMADVMLKQIQSGALARESMSQILNRIRKMFDRKKKNGVREAVWDDPELAKLKLDADRMGLSGAIDIQEGIYTLEDVERLKETLRAAMGWEYRQDRAYFTDSLRRNNKWLMSVEKVLSADSLDRLYSGQLQIGPKEMGIKDMTWVVHRPGVCDCCDRRDGLTMTEIKKDIDDEYGSQPPPLHPNCNCRLVPTISEEWSEKNLSSGEDEWDEESGIVYRADKEEKKLGFRDMTLNQYLNSIGD